MKENNLEEKKKSKGNHGQFFSVSAEVVNAIALQTGWAEPVLAYLVLAKCKEGGTLFSTGGAPAIANALGITRYRAEQLIKELEKVRIDEDGFLRAVMTPAEWNRISCENVPSQKGKYPVKVLPEAEGGLIYLPNQIVEGFGSGKNNPPLKKINKDVVVKAERLDTIMLLLRLYQHNRLADFGGVDPSLVCRVWQEIYKVQIPAESRQKVSAELGWYGKVQRTPEFRFFSGLGTLFDADKQRSLRALRLLHDLHLIHEIAMVFDEDPLESNRAEALYPLHVFDGYVRETEEEEIPVGGLAELAAESLARSDLEGVGDAEKNQDRVKADKVFAYGAPSPDAIVMSVFRLKYLPKIQDTGLGLQAEKERAGRWYKIFMESCNLKGFEDNACNF